MGGHVLSLGTTTQNAFYAPSQTTATKMTQPTRSGRIPTKKVPWEEREIPPLAIAAKKSKKKEVQVLETRAASPNAPPVIYELVDAPPIDYSPPI